MLTGFKPSFQNNSKFHELHLQGGRWVRGGVGWGGEVRLGWVITCLVKGLVEAMS